MTPKHVIAVDPGKTTGYATWGSGVLKADQDEDVLNFAHRLDIWLDVAKSDGVVVCERFIINVNTVGNTQAPWSLELIGICRYLAAKHRAPFVLQTPADAKQFMKDERLKKLEWWQKGKPHANDALRHLGLYLVTHGLMSADVL